jgi:hypothetical protein
MYVYIDLDVQIDTVSFAWLLLLLATNAPLLHYHRPLLEDNLLHYKDDRVPQDGNLYIFIYNIVVKACSQRLAL